MGIVAPGFPADIALELAQIERTSVFVETGTFRGGTSRWAASHFERVHTVERAEALYRDNAKHFDAVPNLVAHLGDSRTVLPRVLAEIGSQPALFWLDGHWSGGVTAGAGDECPLLDEMALLADRGDDLILIDDARFFLSAPPAPHDPACWPTLIDIVHALPDQGGRCFMQIIDDVIFIVPRKLPLVQALIAHARRRPRAWQAAAPAAPFRGRRPGLARRVGRKLKSLLSP